TAIIQAICGEYKIEDADDNRKGFPFIVLIIIIIVVFSFIRGGGPFIPGGVYRTGTRSGGWSSGSSWGGSSGWSGGGFSGGGGSFGGGGASGSW
ncbi:MAG TPA: hypothetical protein VF870_09625, partial [Ignavibacteriaceae bacterium]